MNSWTEREFRRRLSELPAYARIQASAAYQLFRADPFHGSLQFKSVTSSGRIWSARVGRGYRVVGRREGDTIVWFWIGTHAEYDQLLRRR